MKPAIQLVKNMQDGAICETQPRYDVILYGARVSQLYFNLRGYCGVLPLPSGDRLNIGERSISAYKREVSALNKQFAAYGKEAAA